MSADKVDITVLEVLRCWRKYDLAIRPGTQVRHGTTGEFGETIGPAINPSVWQVRVRLDDGTEFDTGFHKLFPAWWPDAQWPWLEKKAAI